MEKQYLPAWSALLPNRIDFANVSVAPQEISERFKSRETESRAGRVSSFQPKCKLSAPPTFPVTPDAQ